MTLIKDKESVEFYDLQPARYLYDHKLNGLNEKIDIQVLDDAGPGGANHAYEIALETDDCLYYTGIKFQNGPVKEAGYNGITNESLLAVVIDRLRGFQYGRNPDGSFNQTMIGQYACRENAIALENLESALMWLQKRTRDRMNRGVEGTNKI